MTTSTTAVKSKKRLLAWLPLALLVLLVMALGLGMTRDPQHLPSTLIDRPAPAFALEELGRPGTVSRDTTLRGQVVLLNVWASWCTACREEHPTLMAIARAGQVPLYGIDYKDRRDAALDVLARQGNPFVTSWFDGDGRTGIDYGVYGVPETLVIDRGGIVRYRHVGPVSDAVLRDTLMPLVKRLQADSGAS